MKHLLHPKFRINGQNFSSKEVLKQHAKHLLDSKEEEEVAIGSFILEWLDANDFIAVKTSGSTGSPKIIKLQKEHVFNSATATVNYFNLKENCKALLCLPAAYIAGKMMLVRGMIAGWNLYTRAPVKNPLENLEIDFDFTAMVPYQVFHSLEDLHKVKKLIIGGGAVSVELEKELQLQDTLAFSTYGMTETISHVAIRALNGIDMSKAFNALPTVKFSQTADGCLQISAPKISEEVVVTNDVVNLLSPTSFIFLGRKDNVINSGGVKVHPEEIEEKLSRYIDIPFFIASEKDEALGERVIMVVEAENTLGLKDFSEALTSLYAYEKPKKIYTVPQFIYTDTSKIKRVEVLQTLNKG
ncbi:AMP-binding protein [Aequorivita sediminis]|uniref:AMP-binding protein n=1 Tax=Aequorivita sediminis TaxID=3073653 RepID=UPI0028A9DE93|nr:AMP-binding protein [Aequorivita sp. F6058]